MIRRHAQSLVCALVLAAAVGAVWSNVSAQAAARLFATLSANLTTGVSTPVTCTVSGTGCFLDVQIAGGGGTFSSPVLISDGTAISPGLAFSSEPGLGISRSGTGNIFFDASGVPFAGVLNGTGFSLVSNRSYSWSSGTTDPSASIDTQLMRVGAGIVGVTNAIRAPGAGVTASVVTGVTTNANGQLQTATTSITITSAAFTCAAVTCDVTIATLPANTWLMNVTASLTTVYACASTCTTGTLSMVLGKGAGGSEYLASLDADAATSVFGDADAELGTLNARAAAVQGGTFTATSQAVVLRLTSGTGNIGTGAATNLSQGTITFWLTTTRLS